jgi:hypothetical protein
VGLRFEVFGFDDMGFLPVLEPLMYTICILMGVLGFLINYYS